MFKFEQLESDPKTGARTGRITTTHGVVETPVFMPVGTQGSVKALSQQMMEEAGVSILLGNTYHLFLRPGHTVVNRLGGLHKFISWPRPILTDSGGFQIFSLGSLCKVSEDGVSFQSHVDGSSHFLSPEKSMEIQAALGSDVVMTLDHCLAQPATKTATLESLELTERWARRSKNRFTALHASESEAREAGFEVVNRRQALFCVNQGGLFPDLRERSLAGLVEIGFDGYAIGGLSVGEEKSAMYEIVSRIAPMTPADSPRYLMGVGTPEDLIEAVSHGVDMFDCVMPTRNARNGQLFTSRGRLNIRNARYREDQKPLDEACRCPVCLRYSRAYLRHLYSSGEVLASVLSSLHNVSFYLDTMSRMRQAITLGAFSEFRIAFLNDFRSGVD